MCAVMAGEHFPCSRLSALLLPERPDSPASLWIKRNMFSGKHWCASLPRPFPTPPPPICTLTHTLHPCIGFEMARKWLSDLTGDHNWSHWSKQMPTVHRGVTGHTYTYCDLHRTVCTVYTDSVGITHGGHTWAHSWTQRPNWHRVLIIMSGKINFEIRAFLCLHTCSTGPLHFYCQLVKCLLAAWGKEEKLIPAISPPQKKPLH